MAKLQWYTDDRLCPVHGTVIVSFSFPCFLWTSHLSCGLCNHLRYKFEPGTVPWRLKEDVICIPDFSKFMSCKYPYHPNSCRTLVELDLTIKVNCLLTIFIVSFPFRWSVWVIFCFFLSCVRAHHTVLMIICTPNFSSPIIWKSNWWLGMVI